MKNNLFFEKLTVVEFASVLAGPLTGSFFAELGAKVIKIENAITNGDVTRNWKTPKESETDISAYYASANTFKEEYLLNLSDSVDYQKSMEFVRNADVVLTNFKAQSAKKLQLAFEDFKKINPTIIHASIEGFASQSDRSAYDVVLQAETGFMSMNGQKNNPPTKMPVAMIDILAAHQLKQGILVALLNRSKEQQAQYVSVNLEQAAITALANQASNWLMNGEIAKQIGSLHPNIAPYGETFLCKDNNYVVLAIGSNPQFSGLCNILNKNALALNPLFSTNKLRVKNREALQQALANAFAQVDSKKLMDSCEKQGVPIGIVKTMNQVFESQAAQEMVLEENKNGQTLKKVRNVAFEIST